jgi:DNA-binding XRE family transcriptional regulator
VNPNEEDAIQDSIRIAQFNAKLKNYEVADAVGITSQHLSHLKGGTKKPSWKVIVALAKLFNYQVWEFIKLGTAPKGESK